MESLEKPTALRDERPDELEARNAEGMYRLLTLRLGERGLELPKDKRGLEIGSGTGALVECLQKHGYDVAGIDIAPRGRAVEKGDVADLSHIESGSLGYVISKSVFDNVEHARQREQGVEERMLEEVARVLEGEGFYLASENFFADHEESLRRNFDRISDPTEHHFAIYKKKAVVNA